MKRDFYKLANQIDSSCESSICVYEVLDDQTRQKYRHDVLTAIHREKTRKRGKRIAAAAACIAVMAAGMVVFQKEVQAAIEQIHMSLGAALGLESDYAARYTEVLHTSVSSGGYAITLDEVIAAPNKLYAIFFIEREDGGQVPDLFYVYDHLSVNGAPAFAGGIRGYSFADEERRIMRAVAEYSLPDRKLSGENVFELRLESEDEKAGWEFRFRADSSEVYKDTKIMALGSEYMLSDGTKLTLDEMILTKMGQQITFHLSGSGNYHEIQLHMVDEQGREALFRMGQFYEDEGCLENSFVSEDDVLARSWIAEDAKKLEVTAYVMDGPEIDGHSEDAYKKQIGETVVWDLTKLESMGK